MAGANHVVVRYIDGKMVKGTTENFFPNRPTFHVKPAVGGPPVAVRCCDLKAVFFVKSLEGSDPWVVQGFGSATGSALQGKKIAVLFNDGELICGHSLAYVPGREGFFLTPAASDSNNLRIYIVNVSVREIKAGPEAEALARKILAGDSSSKISRSRSAP